MKYIRWGTAGAERPGLLHSDGRRLDLAGFGEDFGEQFWASNGPARLQDWLAGRDLPIVPPTARWGPPIVRPSKIICVGLNYADHARESQAAPPAEPLLFMKATTALCGPFDELLLPPGSEKTDWEVELAVLVGKEARCVPEAAAMDYVAGYVLHNDYSERTWQLERGGQWVKGKSFDTFAPLGPFLASRDEIPDPQNLSMWLDVNGIRRQQSHTGNMIFGVARLLSYISHCMTLLPGDLISTGTPAGVGLGMKPPQYLRAGDVVELGIEGLGRARQQVRAGNEGL